jgi:transcriptional regulator with XRE-family HTH domain
MQNDSVDTPWFRSQLVELDISQRKFAEMLGVSQPAVSKMVNGTRRMSNDEAARIAEIFRVPLEEVVRRGGTRVAQGPGTSPVVATFDDQGELRPRKSGARAPTPAHLPSSAVAARCEETQALYFGWTVFYMPGKAVSPDAIGKLSVVETTKGQTLLRFVRHGFERGTYQLTSMAGEVIDGAELVTASPVLWAKP